MIADKPLIAVVRRETRSRDLQQASASRCLRPLLPAYSVGTAEANIAGIILGAVLRRRAVKSALLLQLNNTLPSVFWGRGF
jgi:hypothetical protein